ncbi:MAG: MBL fold metallo-hydrolase [Ruminococcaceae bacterium]|nr:MBL fold metallo-hydrolase [Oscillospiraceae bacterium]
MAKKKSRNRKRKLKGLKALLALALIICAAIALKAIPGAWEFLSKYLPFIEEPRQITVPDGDMAVHFLDVGQGDCSLIVLPSGKTVLIDASTNDEGDNIIEYLSYQKVKHIDYFVLTHPHADHIGSAKQIIEALSIGKVVMPDIETDTATFTNLLLAIDKKDIPIHVAKVGDIIKLDNTNMKILGPVNKTDDLNNMSIVLRLDYGKTSFMFTGDAEEPSEKDMLKRFSSSEFRADVLKVGHHGASTSSSLEFITAISPKYAVISCGKDNTYGHPHTETIKTLNKLGIKYYRTDKVGNVVFSSDGEKVTLLRPTA